jgi:putative inorganic carbon (HCO3(-)) transporter
MQLFRNNSWITFALPLLFLVIGFCFYYFFKDNFIVYLSLIPLALLLINFAIFYTEKLFLIAVFLTPLSISLRELGFADGHQSLDLSLPTEPIFAGLLLLGIIHQIYFNFLEKKFIHHALSVIIIIQLIWILITSLTSTLPVVSLKFLAARLWLVGSSFYFASYLFKHIKHIYSFIVLYLLGLLIVIAQTTVKHAGFGFSDEVSNWIMTPFYNDHTAYGAAIAMFLPISVGFIFMKNKSIYYKLFFLVASLLLLTGIYLSTARAAWLSLAGSVFICLTLLLKIKFRSIFILLLSIAFVFIAFQNQIIVSLEKNKADSEGNKADNIASITNIKTDPSNVERLNRWNCALRMFDEKPFLGFGPGTYILQYAPFQKSSEKTIISNNDGSNGNAHSEYLGPLAEQGFIGTFIVLLLVIVFYFKSYKLYYSLHHFNTKILVGSIIVGMSTYFIHGLLNNFLDSDKLAVPFWGFLAIIVAIDCFHQNFKPDSGEAAN